MTIYYVHVWCVQNAADIYSFHECECYLYLFLLLLCLIYRRGWGHTSKWSHT